MHAAVQAFAGLVLLGLAGSYRRRTRQLTRQLQRQRIDAARPVIALGLDLSCRRPDYFAFRVSLTNVGTGPALNVGVTLDDAYVCREAITGRWADLPPRSSFAIRETAVAQYIIPEPLARTIWEVVDALDLPLASYPYMLTGALRASYDDVFGNQFWSELRFKSPHPTQTGFECEPLSVSRSLGSPPNARTIR